MALEIRYVDGPASAEVNVHGTSAELEGVATALLRSEPAAFVCRPSATGRRVAELRIAPGASESFYSFDDQRSVLTMHVSADAAEYLADSFAEAAADRSGWPTEIVNGEAERRFRWGGWLATFVYLVPS